MPTEDTAKKVYIAATRQNDGKTLVSLGLLAAFRDRFKNVGYIKPVGQQYREIKHHKIDKDAILMHDAYQLPDDYEAMSPIAVPSSLATSALPKSKTEPTPACPVPSIKTNSLFWLICW